MVIQKSKCEILVSVLNKVYDDRLKIQRKLKKRKYNKRSIFIFKKYLTIKEYLLLKYLFLKLLKHKKLDTNKPTKLFIKNLFKFKCDNVFFREYHVGTSFIEKYKTLKDSSFFTHDKRVNLDVIVIDMIKREG